VFGVNVRAACWNACAAITAAAQLRAGRSFGGSTHCVQAADAGKQPRAVMSFGNSTSMQYIAQTVTWLLHSKPSTLLSLPVTPKPWLADSCSKGQESQDQTR
jgi:hypothetical protein